MNISFIKMFKNKQKTKYKAHFQGGQKEDLSSQIHQSILMYVLWSSSNLEHINPRCLVKKSYALGWSEFLIKLKMILAQFFRIINQKHILMNSFLYIFCCFYINWSNESICVTQFREWSLAKVKWTFFVSHNRSMFGLVIWM